MIDLIEKLKEIALRAQGSDAKIIGAAVDRIKELEAILSEYQEDITDWHASVETQMSRRKNE
jgi:hypothetical protein